MIRKFFNSSNWAEPYTVWVGDNPVVIPPGEKLTGLSETIPGQGITPKEVVSRYVNRQSLTVMDGVYTDNKFLPDNYERMSKVERAELSHHLTAIMADRRARMQARRTRPVSAPADSSTPPSSPPREAAPPLGDGGEA